MPVSYIDVPRGISPAGKEKLVKDVFEAIHDAYMIPDTRVFLHEWPAEHISIDGELAQPMRNRQFGSPFTTTDVNTADDT